MLTFLRKIRQSMIGSSSFSKYLIYAIGEIALVVIGILLAVQINNWNEGRKSSILEKELLSEIQNNIEVNSDLLRQQIIVIENLNTSSDKVISLIENKGKYDQNIEKEFYYSFYSGTNIYLSNNGYEALENAGFEIVKNTPLKKVIIDLFGVKNLKLAQFINYIKENFKVYESYLIQNFHTEEQRLIPIDYQLLINDPQFLAIVKRMKERRTKILNNLNNNFEENLEVLQLLKEELGDTL